MKSYAQLPFQFDSVQLYQELEVCKQNWTRHFNTAYYSGEWSGIPLRSPKGESHELSAGHADSQKFVDEAILESIPYTRSVIEQIKAPKSAVRYLRLTPGSQIKPHKDYDLVFWDGFVRLHIPVTTNDRVKFMLNNQQLKMQQGECWFADFSQVHSVENLGKTDRVHLVIDCQVNEWMRSLFIKTGIIEPHEEAPSEMENYDDPTKQKIIEQLEAMGTDVALEIVEKMRSEL
ncbi:aspartyl/asparaginyl beta-hydroxylase domain-containing protein [Fulvivirga sp. 29W222]|uniref:Aspartyl/asparaginyl beta-hydroxylase domain-containing protein n=1 Tax=Fulvivirga marina TaxID=2494733 RepID=A0A937FWK9_9BACT|nr:aspartyl/asparaginyl beta-hydroxylase domain-containing protein [Fulvivirga marina]MBL6446332.1 aspartyl/asparaginyl beta-hydroxylase domain-containing protein [Fulvivirga marina]